MTDVVFSELASPEPPALEGFEGSSRIALQQEAFKKRQAEIERQVQEITEQRRQADLRLKQQLELQEQQRLDHDRQKQLRQQEVEKREKIQQIINKQTKGQVLGEIRKSEELSKKVSAQLIEHRVATSAQLSEHKGGLSEGMLLVYLTFLHTSIDRLAHIF